MGRTCGNSPREVLVVLLITEEVVTSSRQGMVGVHRRKVFHR